MKRLDRFIVKAFVGPFMAILLVVIFILMLQFLWLYIDELVGKGLSFGVILEFMMWGGCTILPLALPLATLLSSMMTIGQMAENNELLAIKASGVSLGRVMMPIMVCSIFIATGTFFATNNLVPEAYNQIYTLRDDIARTKSEIKIPSGTFYDGIDGYILRAGAQNDETGMMQDVMVYDHTQGKGNTTMILADSALLKMSKRKDYLIFDLYNGTSYQETNTKKYRDTTLELEKVNFISQEIVIPLTNYTFQKSDSVRFNDQVKSMRLSDLTSYKDTLTVKDSISHTASLEEFLSGRTFTFKRQLSDTLFAKGGRSNFHSDNFMKFKDDEQALRATERAKSRVDEAIIHMQQYQVGSSEATFYLRRTDIEIYKKFAVALCCFILFFIGAPLGALIRKGGLGVSAIVSALFFVLYWVIDITGVKLAKDGAVTPIVGTFISSAVLLPIGIYLTIIAIRDSQILNMDGFKTGWRKFRSKIMSIFKKTRIVYMGTPEFAVAPLDALVSKGYKVVGVVTVADKPSGRGLKVNESAVKKYAVEHNIPVLQPLKLKDPEFLSALKAWKADMFVVVAFRMLPEEVWSMPKLGTINLHGALLPQYRGAAPINWAVINGEKLTGVTTFMIDKDIDTGGIILRQEVPISETDTAGDLHDKLMPVGAQLVIETVEGLIQKNVETRVQRSFIQGSEVLHPAPKITRETCHIDWTDTTKHIYNLIRGLSPYPTSYTDIAKDGQEPVQLKIFFAEKMAPESVPAGLKPGAMFSDGKSYLAIATGDGAVSLKDIQLAGKKRMDVQAFLAGFRDPDSYKAI